MFPAIGQRPQRCPLVRCAVLVLRCKITAYQSCVEATGPCKSAHIRQRANCTPVASRTGAEPGLSATFNPSCSKTLARLKLYKRLGIARFPGAGRVSLHNEALPETRSRCLKAAHPPRSTRTPRYTPENPPHSPSPAPGRCAANTRVNAARAKKNRSGFQSPSPPNTPATASPSAPAIFGSPIHRPVAMHLGQVRPNDNSFPQLAQIASREPAPQPMV